MNVRIQHKYSISMQLQSKSSRFVSHKSLNAKNVDFVLEIQSLVYF